MNVTIGATKIAAGWWADANYDSNTYDRVRFSNPIKAKTAISASRFIVGDAGGYFHLAANVPFDVQKPILYSTAYIALKAQGSANYLTYPSCSLRVHVANFSGATQTTCYIVGTLVGTTFTPTNELFTTTEPTSEDGLTYMALGHMFSAYQIYLLADHSMYRFANGGFKSLTQLSAEALAAANETRTEMRTKFEQTDAALALKADSVTVSSLGERVTAAEQKVTPQAITSTLTSSALFDYVTGVMCAIVDKKLSSEVGFKGICKKVLILLLVSIAHIVDMHVIGAGSALRGAVICYYLSNEGVSILENAAHIGLPVPEKLKAVLEQLHDRNDKAIPTDEGDGE